LSRRFDFRRYLNIRSASCPSFSPDNEYVAFLTNITGVPQVWRVALGGGWPEQLTFYGEEASFCRYAPVGDRLIFGMDQGGNERVQLYMIEQEEALIEQLTDMPRVIHMFGDWAADGRWIMFSSNERHEAFFDAYVMDVESKEVHRILQGRNDPRGPQSETDQMVEALRAWGIPVTYVLFGDEGHGIVKLKNRIVAYEAIVQFLDKHIGASHGG